MTEEDKQLVADYMGWEKGCDYHEPCNPLYSDSCEGCRYVNGVVNYDLNDAGLCVQEMARNGAWRSFYESCFPLFVATNPLITSPGFLNLWLYDAGNFFTALAAWIKEGREEK